MMKPLMGVGAMLLAILALAAVATADSEKDTKVILKSNPNFHGLIETTAKACVEGRTIKVLKKTDDRDKIIGGSTTDSEGLFSVPEPNVKPGVYYAKVRRVTLENGQFCAGDRSNKITIP